MPKLDNLQTFQASLAAASILVTANVLKAANEEAVPKALAYARQTVAEDSGDTKRSIATKAYKRGSVVFVEMSAEHTALFLEYGTVNMSPRPFMFDSLRKTQDPLMEAMADIGEELLAGG